MSSRTAQRNGTPPAAASPEATVAAIATENEIAARAAEIRGDADGLDRALFLKLWPLLREPIPAGFIKSLPALSGKPYESTGVKSVQVQIGRMDNVLTPLGWRDDVEFSEDGKVCRVRVEILHADGSVMFWRESWGGVNQASTLGNLRKGSYTNAAKLAFARVGPAHEVYIGATDLDPDVHEKAAAEQDRPLRPAQAPSQPSNDRPLTDEERLRVVEHFKASGIEDMTMFLTAVGVDTTDELTTALAFGLRSLLDEHLKREAAR